MQKLRYKNIQGLKKLTQRYRALVIMNMLKLGQ